MRLDDFNYVLPEDRIAQEPIEPRDKSKLMVLERASGLILHHVFSDLPKLLDRGDVLVLNKTKVIPARLWGCREKTGSVLEVLLLTRLDMDRWEVMVRPGRKARIGERLVFGNGELTAEVMDNTSAGGRVLKFFSVQPFELVLEKLGHMPLPPYIKNQIVDADRYQTVYASELGSAAAPTAGLHFTPSLLSELEQSGVEIVQVLLHIGLGTFRPVSTEDIREHKMHAEYYRVDEKAALSINQARANGKRIVAVGTTAVRTLETVADQTGTVFPASGLTEIFIYPGYEFKVVDAIITNFHLPRSTLLMLVSSFAGRERILEAYEQAIESGYRFYSFGDAMLII